jgi:hypothetical protein
MIDQPDPYNPNALKLVAELKKLDKVLDVRVGQILSPSMKEKYGNDALLYTIITEKNPDDSANYDYKTLNRYVKKVLWDNPKPDESIEYSPFLLDGHAMVIEYTKQTIKYYNENPTVNLTSHMQSSAANVVNLVVPTSPPQQET